MSTKERITKKILNVIREAEEHGIIVAVAGDDEGNFYNRLTSREDYGVYDNTQPNAIVLGTYGRVDEEEIMSWDDEDDE